MCRAEQKLLNVGISDFKFVAILVGGPACCFCVPVSDLLPHRPTVHRVSEAGAATLDVWPASDHLL